MIKPKEKPCKGLGIAHGYGCGKLTMHRVNGLCKMECYPSWLLNSENGKIKLAKSIIHAKKEKKKIENAFKSDLRAKLKTLGQFEAEAKKVFQKWIRLRDEGKECISCGATNPKGFDAGHFKKAEIYSGVIFDERNVNRQCTKCNRFLGGNELMYREGLIKRYGIYFVKELEMDANKTRNKKYTREELIEIKQYYAEKIRNKDY
jgi:hypothetical protein